MLKKEACSHHPRRDDVSHRWWQFLEELKKNEEYKDIPVLLFTAKHVWPEEYSRYANDIRRSRKPISLAELKAALESPSWDASSHMDNALHPRVRAGSLF